MLMIYVCNLNNLFLRCTLYLNDEVVLRSQNNSVVRNLSAEEVKKTLLVFSSSMRAFNINKMRH